MQRFGNIVTATAKAGVLTLGLGGMALAQEQILISSEWGNVKAELVDNGATRSLVRMLPVTIEMRRILYRHTKDDTGARYIFGTSRNTACREFDFPSE